MGGRKKMQSSGKTCREIAKLYPSVIACDKREAFAQGSEATTLSAEALAKAEAILATTWRDCGVPMHARLY
jgi:hypothetical protein